MINFCDWTLEFEMRFNHNQELMNIKANRLFGKLEINFQSGVPINCNFTKHIPAVNIETNTNPNKREER